MSTFTHIDAEGRVRMVDVSEKKADPQDGNGPGAHFHEC